MHTSKGALWPVAGIVLAIGLAAATNPARAMHVTLQTGIAVLVTEMVLVLILSAHPVGARAGVLMAGLFLLLASLRHNLAFVPLSADVLHVRALRCRHRTVVFATTRQLPGATGANVRMFLSRPGDAARTRFRRGSPRSNYRGHGRFSPRPSLLSSWISGPGFWQPARWLAGGIGILAAAEMATACHDFATKLMGRAPCRRSFNRLIGQLRSVNFGLDAGIFLRRSFFENIAMRHWRGAVWG